MDSFFNPESIVIIGASNSPFNLGGTIAQFLSYLNFRGMSYVVNTRGEDVHGARGYSSVPELPDMIDLAVIIAPAHTVPRLVRECGEKGIRNIIIETAEFAETGEHGSRLQDEINEYTREFGIRFMGPNCLGTLNAHERFSSFFGFVPGMYDEVFDRPGTISYVIQSGGVGVLIMDSFRRDVTNVNKMVSIGNKEDIDESDLIRYFNTDNTEVIGLYLENIRDGRKFIETARNVQKPVLLFKVGRTGEGARAAMSHTAGMANNDVILDNACRQAGIIRLRSVSELFSIPKIFTHMPLLKGDRIAVFTNSGAFGGISADLIMESGLSMASLSPEIREKLRNTGKLYNVGNPIDLGPTLSKETFLEIYSILLSSDEVDGLLAVPNIWQKVVIEGIIDLVDMCRKYKKPAAIYIPNAVERIIAVRNEFQLPVFESLEEAVRALSVSFEHYRALKKKEILSVPS